jgi:hypothetical protein
MVLVRGGCTHHGNNEESVEKWSVFVVVELLSRIEVQDKGQHLLCPVLFVLKGDVVNILKTVG